MVKFPSSSTALAVCAGLLLHAESAAAAADALPKPLQENGKRAGGGGGGALPGKCVEPAVCAPPAQAQFQRVMAVPSRQQWEQGGGYCGSLSIQAIAQSYGAWISQAEVRKAAGPGGGHGDKENGYEILHTNIGGALDNLKLTYSAWDYTQPVPQSNEYLTWLKSELAAGHPVVWMIMCKGDSHDTYGIANYDHVEPVWGLYSNHSLDDHTVYPDDVLVHGADYGAFGVIEGPSLYRRFDGLADSKAMDGNCSAAHAGVGHNEYYPCIANDGRDWGFAITGYASPPDSSDVPASLAVNSYDEPDTAAGSRPMAMKGTLSVGPGLKSQTSYTIYRWDDYRQVPTDGNYVSSNFTSKHEFTATSETFTFNDPTKIISSGTTYYRVQPTVARR